VTPFAFFVAEDPTYTIVDSALDSIRFLANVSERDRGGRLLCASVDADADGNLVRYRGRLMEGVGYCADSVFGSHVLVRFGRWGQSRAIEEMGFSYLDHALAAGFFEAPDVPAYLYRDTETGAMLHNLEARDEYLELGHIARVGYQLLRIAELDPDPERARRCRGIAVAIAEWAAAAARCANGWYPRRCTPDREVFPLAPDAFGPTDLGPRLAPDPIHDRSGAGLFVVQLLAAVVAAGLADLRETLERDVAAFIDGGGHFGSTNTDTEDLHENVSYAIGFQALLAAAEVTDSRATRAFAYERCLEPLARFELASDVNGVATKGLLYMEESWNAACTWEMAEAAQAYLEAFGDRGSRADAFKALTILRATAKHHHGEHGFLTEAVDWDGHSVSTRHFPGERYGDIRTTHPFLNNLHIVHPTITFLERFSCRARGGDDPNVYDLEGNVLCRLPISFGGP
jgi:hypothetical protein